MEKDIAKSIEEQILGIKVHLETIKKRQNDDDLTRLQMNQKLDLIVNSLTDTPYNAESGVISRLNAVEKTTINHDLYWKLLFTIVIASGLVGGILKLLLK